MKNWFLFSLFLTLAASAACFYIDFAQRENLLERIPIHWNASMEPDGWVDRDDVLAYFLIFPGVMALMTLLMLVLPWLSPKNFEIDSFANIFGFVMSAIILLFGYLLVLQLLAAMGKDVMTARLFVSPFFLLFAVIGAVMGRVQRNFWMGVRTPWTLASEAVWTGTHRLARRLWVATGAIGFAAVMLGVNLLICFAFLVTMALIPVVYSLVLYKRLQRQGKI
jgi:uncharacterized membrane protein